MSHILAERARDAWAVLRAVPANEGEAALRRYGRAGSRDGLSEDMLEIARALDTLSRARIEQDVENEQVRRLRREGRCPVCGVDQDGH